MKTVGLQSSRWRPQPIGHFQTLINPKKQIIDRLVLDNKPTVMKYKTTTSVFDIAANRQCTCFRRGLMFANEQTTNKHFPTMYPKFYMVTCFYIRFGVATLFPTEVV